MNVHKRHSIIDRIQGQSSFTVFQPSFFSSSFEPDSLEDFDFESAPMSNINNTTTINEETHSMEEDEPIPHSSGVTSNSNVTSFASTAPILHNQQLQKQPTTEEYHLKPMKTDEDSQETLKYKDNNDQQPPSSSNFVCKDRPRRNYENFRSNTKFHLDGRLVTSQDYRAFIAGLLLLISPTVLFAVFT
jgi:palmitoyltransferase ZDHHC9/14/18